MRNSPAATIAALIGDIQLPKGRISAALILPKGRISAALISWS